MNLNYKFIHFNSYKISSLINYSKLLTLSILNIFILDFLIVTQPLLSFTSNTNSKNKVTFTNLTTLSRPVIKTVFSEFIYNDPIVKTYGPLLIDINNVKFYSGLFFIPMLNVDYKPLFLAINCNDNIMNIKDNNAWKGWFKPFFTYELNIFSDFCQTP